MKHKIKFSLLFIIFAGIISTNISGTSLCDVNKEQKNAFNKSYIQGNGTSLHYFNSEAYNDYPLSFKDALEVGEKAYSGVDFLLDPELKLPCDDFNYETGERGYYLGWETGFAPISLYMATGEEKYLELPSRTADFLEQVMKDTNLIPDYQLNDKTVEPCDVIMGDNGQTKILEYVAYLAKYNKKYLPLMNRLAKGVIDHGINLANDLAWYAVDSDTGEPVENQAFGYEAHLGGNTSCTAEALLAAYETDHSKAIYLQEAEKMLLAVWNCRNSKTGLIPESWDTMNNKVGSKLYPYSDFRYDDMGGVYIRSLILAYKLSGKNEFKEILNSYTPNLVNHIWNKNIDGGAFRYLNPSGGGPQDYIGLETMHGLFTATLLQALPYLKSDKERYVLNKVITNADHVMLDEFGIRNGLIPHQINYDGNYVNSKSDSELCYSVIQYPFGYEYLSQITGNNAYREKDNKCLRVLIDKASTGDDETSPEGILSVIETTPPYSYENEYGSPDWMVQALYFPAYLLYNSIHPSKGVSISWHHDNQPSVFGLLTDMPYWDTNNVKLDVKNKKLLLSQVTGKGIVDLTDLQFGNIEEVKEDGNRKNLFNAEVLYTEEGTHSYEIQFK